MPALLIQIAVPGFPMSNSEFTGYYPGDGMSTIDYSQNHLPLFRVGVLNRYPNPKLVVLFDRVGGKS